MKSSYSDLDNFLEDIKRELVYRHLSYKLEQLKKHLLEQRTESITLSFDNCTLELPGNEEVAEAVRSLERALSKTKIH
ncbi:MAG TPA: hypothetical protein VK094_10000 [Pseudogracilibacillus sp.]|nr:hypothetical protein [Pseudogracilibacillus sp.]